MNNHELCHNYTGGTIDEIKMCIDRLNRGPGPGCAGTKIYDFVQSLVAFPYRKSYDTLRFYIYEQHLLLRCCCVTDKSITGLS